MRNYNELTSEELMELLPSDLMVGLTIFRVPDKFWVVTSYYQSLCEYSDEYDSGVMHDMTHGTWYGMTMHDALVNACDGLL